MKRRRSVYWAEIAERLRLAQTSTHVTEADESKRLTVLRQRAADLAAPLQRENAAPGSEMVMIFRVGSDRFALPLTELVEVIPDVRYAFVPGASAEVAGLIQVRGDVRPVYHLPGLLGLAQNTGSAGDVVLLLQGRAGLFGIGVDEVEDIRAVPDHARRSTVRSQGHAGWMTDDLAPVLSVDTLLERAE